ncbi:MAG: YifB family Mg chelatase-like AAA ATPase [Rhodospirillales bacterium]
MAASVQTVVFQGIDAMAVDVQVQLTGGQPVFLVVGLPDKAVGESRERVRAALTAMGLALPPKRIIVNLSPADVMKEGSHYDLPIALALLVAIGVIAPEQIAHHIALGELALDGRLTAVTGVLPAALWAAQRDKGIICPASCGGEAAWAGDRKAGHKVIAAPDLLSLVNHLRGTTQLPTPEPKLATDQTTYPDLIDVKGQETARRALEVSAAGGHNLLMIGPPGAGKSMLAARLPGLLPPLTPEEALEVSMIRSLVGAFNEGRLTQQRPFRDPHHSATLPALVGGGLRLRPGEVSLAHRGILFLDELPEFSRAALEALRQPIETGRVAVARANAHVTYPARFQLVAAMNPCRCGNLGNQAQGCSRAPRCASEYQSKISGPLLDRIDLTIEVPPVRPSDLSLPPPGEGSAEVAARVAQARDIQRQRYRELTQSDADPVANVPRCNAEADGNLLDTVATPDAEGRALLTRAAERLGLSARGWHRVLRVARTLADLDGAVAVRRLHIAEALSWRHPSAIMRAPAAPPLSVAAAE